MLHRVDGDGDTVIWSLAPRDSASRGDRLRHHAQVRKLFGDGKELALAGGDGGDGGERVCVYRGARYSQASFASARLNGFWVALYCEELLGPERLWGFAIDVG